ncbi:TnsA-like heteromeric transposase endonuclease subunit [Nocardia pseudovaccinii]|uniref:TnsA-like heteromeric transposase endonuclease subunit n=1 Tax=Nocardia pseudovaccinii TaxID=189540 RepID=UPI000A069592|nr:TnsA-like heteromeric transposase endonuclease subunit [Nocardia pseudovaccinii]
MAVSTPEHTLGYRFSLEYLADGERGAEQRWVPLAAVDWSTRFERTAPVREFPSYTGQRSFQGAWWAATLADFVGYESWLERDHVMVMDQASDVIAFASQPFWLHWSDDIRQRRHAPDYFARLVDGTGVVIDVRADDAIGAQDADSFAVTALACEQIGWRYRRVGELDAVLAANLRWLAGYRHPRCRNHEYAGALMRLFAQPAPLLATAEQTGDPIAVLPVLFHLLWSSALTADLTAEPLTATTLVTAAGNIR